MARNGRFPGLPHWRALQEVAEEHPQHPGQCHGASEPKEDVEARSAKDSEVK